MCFLDCQSTRDVLTKVARHPPLLQQPRHMPTLAVGLQQTHRQRHKHKHKQGTCLLLLLACNRLREKNSPSIQAVHHIYVFARPEALIITLELSNFFSSVHARSQHDQCANATEFLDNYRKTEKIELYQKLSKAYATLVGGEMSVTLSHHIPQASKCHTLHTSAYYALIRIPPASKTAYLSSSQRKTTFWKFIERGKGKKYTLWRLEEM